ncbi:MAG TPA: SpoIVB peptidase, partial [Bacillus bacterium]|nr:SpoIVB peptidase [Bacillus sp. (in: firmicutes)]
MDLKKDFFRKFIGGILLVSLIALGFAKPVHEYLSIPGDITLFEGQQLDITASAVYASAPIKNTSIAVKQT